MRNFGFCDYDEVVLLGTNGKMTEISAAMGLTSLESIEEFIDINYRNYKSYQIALSDISGVRIMTFFEGEKWAKSDGEVCLWAKNGDRGAGLG